jgi:hypothetical protein
MTPPDDVQTPRRARLVQTGRALLGAFVVGGGLFAAGVFSSAVPAAPQDCLPPPAGCVSTSLPTVPSVPLPTVPLPTLPTTASTTTTTTTTGGSPGGTTTGTDTSPTDTTQAGNDEPSSGNAALTAHASVRVRGHGAKRVVEIRLRLSQSASVSVLLRRSGRALVRRTFSARAGSRVTVLRAPRKVKPGSATLALTYRPVSGPSLRASYRLRLPR